MTKETTIKWNCYLSIFSFVLCCFTGTTLAAPSVDKVSGNETLTITGSSFGQHDDFSPDNSKTIARGWNNFENGSLLVDDWAHGHSGAYKENWSIGTGSINRPGSTYFAARNYVVSRLGELELIQKFNANEWYWTFYIQISDTCPTSGGQGKFTRIFGGNGNIYFSPYGSSNSIASYFASIGALQWGSPDGLGTNTWHRVEIYMSQSPQEVSVWIDGTHQWTRNDWPASDFNGSSHSWGIGNMVEQVQNTCYHRFDDVFYDHTRARVEIGDSSQWSSITTREIQIPQKWTSTSIDVQANYGAFSSGDVAYLYVIDSDGNVSNDGQGVQIIVGEGGTGEITPDQPPAVTISSPTTGTSYSTEISAQQVITIAGTATDDNSVQSVTYKTDNDQSGSAESTDGYANWSLPITINPGETVVATITVTDNSGQNTSTRLTITATSVASETGQLIWDATEQTGDSTWSNSTVTYCVRLLIEGDNISNSATQVVLGFQGRTSGDYLIRNVSIAQRDSSGSVGDVIDTTWTQVTFDEQAWSSEVTVVAGAEKLSDPVNLNLEPGTDYYVTFKIVSASVYLNPPSGYQELYFVSEDHTSDIDWSGNGYSTRQDYHALSKMYGFTPPSGMTVPSTPVLNQQ